VKNVWHSARVDYLSLGEALHHDELQCAFTPHSAIYPGQFGADQVVVKMEWYPDSAYPVDRATLIYSEIEGHNIGQKFLAHVTENGERVYGYMLESLPARHATIDGLQACKAVLAKLHGLKIIYGALSSKSFLIVDGRALVHGFEGSFSTDYQGLFDAEMTRVEDVLRRGSFSTEHISDDLHAEIFAISQRDDGVHPELFSQAAEQGKIVITEGQHKKLLKELREGQREARSHEIPL
jgi:hypothetical protein